MLAKAVQHFSETTIDDEVVVMNLDSGDFFSLTGTAREIWLLIDGTRDRAALLAELARERQDHTLEIASDLDAFLIELMEAGLLVGP